MLLNKVIFLIEWIWTFSPFEYAVTGVFLLLYALYLLRFKSLARQFKTNFNRLFFKFLIRSIYLGLLFTCLLGPSFGDVKKEIKAVGKDIFIAVDLSESMNANDIQPSRLERLKFELKNIVNAFSSDRIGIIIFSSEAFIQCPLTFDQGAINLFIETLNTNLVSNAGTDFGPPLRMALNKFLEDEKQQVNNNQSRVIILASDGEDFGKDTEAIAEDISKNGIKLFTLGIGTSKGSTIPTRLGGNYKIDREGKVVITSLKPDNLKKLAVLTDGKYFEISENTSDVSRLISAINKIEGQLRDTKKIEASANKYIYFLLGALFLILIDASVSFKTIKL